MFFLLLVKKSHFLSLFVFSHPLSEGEPEQKSRKVDNNLPSRRNANNKKEPKESNEIKEINISRPSVTVSKKGILHYTFIIKKLQLFAT